MPARSSRCKRSSEISEYLSACQLGVTFASIGIGFLGEPAIAELIHPWLGGSLSHGLALAISLTIAYVLTTALHITIGEQVPKLFAISRAEAMARTVARPLYWFTRAFRPFVAALNGASNAILRLLRVNPSAAFEEGGTPEDLKLLIAQSLEGGQLAPDEALMLSGVFELHEQQARQVMTPIPRVVTVDISEAAGAAPSSASNTDTPACSSSRTQIPTGSKGSSTPTPCSAWSSPKDPKRASRQSCAPR